MDSAEPLPRVHPRARTGTLAAHAYWRYGIPPGTGQRICCFTSISASIAPTVTTQLCWWAHKCTRQPYWHHLHRYRRTQYAPRPCAHASRRTRHISHATLAHPTLPKSNGAYCYITCRRRIDSDAAGSITTSSAACSGQQRAPRADGGSRICNPSGHTGRPGLL